VNGSATTMVARMTVDGGYPYARGAYIEVLHTEGEFMRVRPLGVEREFDLLKPSAIEVLPPESPLCTCGLRVAREDGQHPRCRPSVNVHGKRGVTRWGGRTWEDDCKRGPDNRTLAPGVFGVE
jgi:hypothetical protein